jgi:hypothetical protein
MNPIIGDFLEDVRAMEPIEMNSMCGLFLVTLLASAPAFAEPLHKFQVDAGAEKILVAEQRSRECSEPQNRYIEGTGHYAGFHWAQEKGVASCAGNSDSFIEGCEVYLKQVQEYEKCTCEVRRGGSSRQQCG